MKKEREVTSSDKQRLKYIKEQEKKFRLLGVAIPHGLIKTEAEKKFSKHKNERDEKETP